LPVAAKHERGPGHDNDQCGDSGPHREAVRSTSMARTRPPVVVSSAYNAPSDPRPQIVGCFGAAQRCEPPTECLDRGDPRAAIAAALQVCFHRSALVRREFAIDEAMHVFELEMPTHSLNSRRSRSRA
jgi:hypothetical protein